MNTLLRFIIALSLFLAFTAHVQPAMASDQKAVLVTGASTGTSEQLIEKLDAAMSPPAPTAEDSE